MRPFPPPGDRLLPLLSGLLLVVSFPPFSLLPAPFVALVPLLVFLDGLPPGREARWRALRAGYWAGLVYFGLLLYWLIVALIRYSLLAVPAYVLTTLILAGFVAAFAGGVHYATERTPVPAALAAALLWTGLEWLQGHLGDLAFPWLGLGTSLSAYPRLAGAADLVGARGLTFWVVLVNGLLARALIALRAGRPALRPAGAAVLLLAVPIAYGVWRAASLELRPAARVAVVQPNIPEDLKLDRARAVDSSLTALTNLTRRIPPGSVDLVVWPEVAIPALLEHPYEAHLGDAVAELSRRVAAPIAVGGYGMRGEPGDLVFYNSAFLVTPDGELTHLYDKQYLVPFVERVPFVDPDWLERIIGDLQYFGGLGRGEGADAVPVAAGRLGILICYESIFAPLARRYRLAGADYLVNMTNDAWYGREPWYARTSALWQHPAHLVLRAIEQRIGIARAANTGISMFIDPIGRTSERTRLFVPDVRIATVQTTDSLTLFARWGDWLATGAAAASLVLLIYARWAGRPSPSRREPPARVPTPTS